MSEPRTCPECKRALGHRPKDCHERVSRGEESIGACECRCRFEDVPLDASGFYWPNHDRHRGPLPVFAWSAGMLVEITEPAAIKAELARRVERQRRAEGGMSQQRERRAALRREPPVRPTPPPPVVTVPTRREQLIAENLAEMKKRRR